MGKGSCADQPPINEVFVAGPGREGLNLSAKNPRYPSYIHTMRPDRRTVGRRTVDGTARQLCTPQRTVRTYVYYNPSKEAANFVLRPAPRLLRGARNNSQERQRERRREGEENLTKEDSCDFAYICTVKLQYWPRPSPKALTCFLQTICFSSKHPNQPAHPYRMCMYVYILICNSYMLWLHGADSLLPLLCAAGASNR